MNKSEIEAMLKENVCTVKFEKVNGEKRTMKCTLVKNLLPAVVEQIVHPAETRHPQLKKAREQNPNVVAVYEIDTDSWKSFRVDFMESIEVEK